MISTLAFLLKVLPAMHRSRTQLVYRFKYPHPVKKSHWFRAHLELWATDEMQRSFTGCSEVRETLETSVFLRACLTTPTDYQISRGFFDPGPLVRATRDDPQVHLNVQCYCTHLTTCSLATQKHQLESLEGIECDSCIGFA